MEIGLAILLVLTWLYVFWQEHSAKKAIANAKKEGYLEGWAKASETLSDFDLNAWLDQKMSNSKR